MKTPIPFEVKRPKDYIAVIKLLNYYIDLI